MPMYWTAELALGFSEIDDQHKEIIYRINQLVDACANGLCAIETRKMLDYLNTYVDKHFGGEQSIMEEISYPAIDEHLQEHTDFIVSVITSYSIHYTKLYEGVMSAATIKNAAEEISPGTKTSCPWSRGRGWMVTPPSKGFTTAPK